MMFLHSSDAIIYANDVTSSIINVNVPPYTYIFWIIDWKFYMPKIWSNINLDWWYILSLENHIPHVDAR